MREERWVPEHEAPSAKGRCIAHDDVDVTLSHACQPRHMLQRIACQRTRETKLPDRLLLLCMMRCQ